MPEKSEYIASRNLKEFLVRIKKSSVGGAALAFLYVLVHLEMIALYTGPVIKLAGLILFAMLARYFLVPAVRDSSGEMTLPSGKRLLLIEYLTLASAILWGWLLGSGFIDPHHHNIPWDVFVLGGVSSLATISLAPRALRLKSYFSLIIISFVLGSGFDLLNREVRPLEIFSYLAMLGLYCVFLRKVCLTLHDSLVGNFAAEFEVQKQRELFDRLLESIPGFVSILDSKFRYVYVNQRLIDAVGREVFDFRLGSHFAESEFVQKTRSFFDADLVGRTEELNLMFAPAAKSERYLAHWHRAQGSKFVVAICINIDELHRSRLELEKQRTLLGSLSNLSNLAELAAGIAHEINNPISVISGYPELIESTLETLPTSEATQKIYNYCQYIKSGAGQVSRIVRSMKSMANRNSTLKNSQIDLLEVLSDVYLLSETKLSGQGIGFLKPEIPTGLRINANAIQLTQVLLNLIWNARDALLSAEVDTPQKIEIKVLEEADSVQIQVIDNAAGIAAADVEKVLSSTFTTKKDGLGIGLGISKSLAESMGGTLTLTSHRAPTIFSLKFSKHQRIGAP